MKRISLFAPLVALGFLLTACGGGLKGPESLRPPEGEQITPPQQPSAGESPAAPTSPEGEAIAPEDQAQQEPPSDPAMNQVADDAQSLEGIRQILGDRLKDVIESHQITANRPNLAPAQPSLPTRTPATTGTTGQPSVGLLPTPSLQDLAKNLAIDPKIAAQFSQATTPQQTSLPNLQQVVKTLDPTIASKLTQGLNLSGITKTPSEGCGSHPGQKLLNSNCVCSGDAGAGGITEEEKSWVSADPASPLGNIFPADGTVRCVRLVKALQLSYRVANHRDAATHSDIKFEMCRTPDWGAGSECLKATIKGDPNQKDNDTVRITLPQDSAKASLDSGSKGVRDLRYPDDFLYFRFVPIRDGGIHKRGDPTTGGVILSDELIIAGVTLRVNVEGRSVFDTIYRNPCVYRDIHVSSSGLPLESRHSLFFDDSFCIHTNTVSSDIDSSAGTDRDIQFAVLLKEGEPFIFDQDLIFSVLGSEFDQRPHFTVFSLLGSGLNSQQLPLANLLVSEKQATPDRVIYGMKLAWSDNDDFSSGSTGSYGSSLFNFSQSNAGSKERADRLDDTFYIAATGGEANDNWHFKRIAACHVNPYRFAIKQKCLAAEILPTTAGADVLTGLSRTATSTNFVSAKFSEETCPVACVGDGSTN